MARTPLHPILLRSEIHHTHLPNTALWPPPVATSVKRVEVSRVGTSDVGHLVSVDVGSTADKDEVTGVRGFD